MSGTVASVLVVDDDAAVRTLCRVVLEIAGFSVREAGTIAEAEAALAESRPDVVLLDVHLGSDSSDELFRRLRADGVPVAAVTGSGNVSDYLDHADAALSKPFAPDALVELARRLAGR